MTALKSAILNFLKLNSSVKRKNLLAYLRNTGHDVTDRSMRLAIVSLIEDDGIMISSGAFGYRLTESTKDYESALKNLTSYIMKLLKRRKALKRNYARMVKPQLFA